MKVVEQSTGKIRNRKTNIVKRLQERFISENAFPNITYFSERIRKGKSNQNRFAVLAIKGLENCFADAPFCVAAYKNAYRT